MTINKPWKEVCYMKSSLKTKLVKRGPYSYALPLSKEQIDQLGIDPQVDDEVHVELDIDKYTHRLTVQAESEYQRNQRKAPINQMFDDFFKNHPEIKDRDAYLKEFFDEQRKEDPDLFD